MTHEVDVTREHYRKYERIARDLQIKFNGTSFKTFGFSSWGECLDTFKEDPSFNTIDRRRFDGWVRSVRVFKRNAVKGLADFELVCLAKHLLVRDTLGLKPRWKKEE